MPRELFVDGRVQLSPSILEGWRYFEAEIVSEEEMIRRLLRVEEPPSEIMKIGVDIEDILCSRPQTHGVDIDKASVLEATRDFDYFGNYQAEGILQLDGVDLRCKCDSLQANRVIEIKCSKSSRDPDYYIHSYQWRAYGALWNRPVCYLCVKWNDRGGIVKAESAEWFDYTPSKTTNAELVQICETVAQFARKRLA